MTIDAKGNKKKKGLRLQRLTPRHSEKTIENKILLQFNLKTKAAKSSSKTLYYRIPACSVLWVRSAHSLAEVLVPNSAKSSTNSDKLF
ncbi:hypothetical protein PSI23_11020 [Xenorhabdus sp. XENO-10]|uniref:Integrase n=1 Tax=Xenorhabdus yunnanensis TaxID=3025878 RepID=A0ABT5LIW9_9GAMM|nr:hypothetical protein [Xenorhabdus yunnanensis]MDC9589814.1 hypothetical protein [Xenorhabdus yunnanensis]